MELISLSANQRMLSSLHNIHNDLGQIQVLLSTSRLCCFPRLIFKLQQTSQAKQNGLMMYVHAPTTLKALSSKHASGQISVVEKASYRAQTNSTLPKMKQNLPALMSILTVSNLVKNFCKPLKNSKVPHPLSQMRQLTFKFSMTQLRGGNKQTLLYDISIISSLTYTLHLYHISNISDVYD